MKKVILSICIMGMSLTIGASAFADYIFSDSPSAIGDVQIGVWNDVYSGAHVYDGLPFIEIKPSVSVSASVNPGGLGTFSGSASSSAQSMGVSLAMPAVPDPWDTTGLYVSNYAHASFQEYLYYEDGAGTGSIVYHFDLDGSITFGSGAGFSGNYPAAVEVELVRSLFSSANTDQDYFRIIDGLPYGTYDIATSFDLEVDYVFGEENIISTFFDIDSSYELDGAPAIDVDFSGTINWCVTELRDGNGQLLDLTDDFGTPLLLSASGIDYAAPVPIPSAVWLLGSGLLGLVAMRKKLKK